MNLTRRQQLVAGAATLLATATIGGTVGATATSTGRDTIAKARKDLGARIDATNTRIDGYHGTTSPTTVPTPPTTTAPPPSRVCNVAPADGNVAILAAITACPDNSTVLFPPNRSYTQATSIIIEKRKGLVIDGNGSTFTKTSQTPAGELNPQWVLLEVENTTLRNMNIIGSWTPPPNRQIFPGNQFDGAVFVYGGTNIVVEDIKTRNNYGDGILTAPSGLWYERNVYSGQVPRNVRFRRLDIAFAARHCAAPTAGIGIWIEDSTMTDCYYAGIDAEIDVEKEPLRDFHILRNTIKRYYISGAMVPNPGATGDIDGVEIRGNTIGESDTCYPPIYFNDWPTTPGIISNVTVADNTIETISRGIILQRTTGTVTGNRITKTRDLGCGGSNEAVVLNDSPNARAFNNTAIGF